MTTDGGRPSNVSSRLEAIDQFRGFAILLMVLADYMGDVERIPAWLKHAPDIGFTVIDLIAPLFIFAIGLTYGLSYRRRVSRTGRWKTVEHFLVRYFALLGAGFLLTLGGNLSGVYESRYNWGLLQALGMAGLLTLPVISLRSWMRWVIGLALLGGYQLLLDRYWLDMVLNSPHGGLPGALGWGAMLIMATALADLYHDAAHGRKRYPYVALLVLAAGIALSFLVPIAKVRISVSYVLITLGASALIFWGFHWLQARWHLRLPMLTEWGKNALLLYFLHGVLLGVFALPSIPAWYVEAPVWLVVVQATSMVAVLSWIAWYLDKKGLYFSL
jgi:predicted acyltransferase